MPALIIFRSLTHAQRGLRVLQNNAIPARITKAPPGASVKGCTYAIRLSSARLAAAKGALLRLNVPYERILLVAADGSFREAAL